MMFPCDSFLHDLDYFFPLYLQRLVAVCRCERACCISKRQSGKLMRATTSNFPVASSRFVCECNEEE